MTDSSSAVWKGMSTLEACVLIEETCASIYYAFAGIFSDSPQVSTLWTEMALEEESHAEEFRSARAIHCTNYKCFDIENFMIKMILDQINLLNENIRRKTPSLRDAYMIALILEKSVENYHVEASKQVVNPELSRLLDIMVEFSHGHVEMLQHAVDSIDASS
jgi:rubrerythrin